METMWNKVSSRVIFEHKRITLIEDEVELPGGERTKYLKFKSGGKAATIICKRGNKILLQKEYSYPPNKMLFQFPGGSISNDKVPEEGANRELMEESGLKARKIKLLGKYLMDNRRSDTYMYVFLANNFEKKSLEKDFEEQIETFWLTERQVDKLIRQGGLENGFSLAAWALYKLNS